MVAASLRTTRARRATLRGTLELTLLLGGVHLLNHLVLLLLVTWSGTKLVLLFIARLLGLCAALEILEAHDDLSEMYADTSR